jgi:hypothetical protein
MERIPTNIDHGRGALKITLAGTSGKYIRLVKRGKFKAGETWRGEIAVKTNGALGGSPSSSQWGLRLALDAYVDGVDRIVGAWTAFGTNLAVYTTYTADLTIVEETSCIEIRIAIDTVTGTAWFDDAQLYRVAP